MEVRASRRKVINYDEQTEYSKDDWFSLLEKLRTLKNLYQEAKSVVFFTGFWILFEIFCMVFVMI